MRQRAWHGLGRVVMAVHHIATDHRWEADRSGIRPQVDREPLLIVVAVIVATIVLATQWALSNLVYGIASAFALFALQRYGETKPKVVAGWALTTVFLYVLLYALVAVILLLAVGVKLGIEGKLL